MQIGFYGDSFCMDNKKGSYIKYLEEHYKTKITKVGRGGCSHWDIIINQFLPDSSNLPDICIFTWPDENRFFHRKVRHIRLKESLEYSKEFKFTPTYSFGFFRKVWKAAEEFYNHLYDEEKNLLEYKSALYYFDNVILPKYKNTQFIHLWSYEKKHNWQTGKEIEEGLMSITEKIVPNYYDNFKKNMLAWNHMPGEKVNKHVFNLIKDKIEND